MALGKRCRRRPLALAALLAPAALAQRPLDWREDSCGEALRACQWSTGLRLLPAAEATWSRRQIGDFCGDEGCARWMEASRGSEDESCGFRGAARLAEALERACDAVEDEVKAERRMAQEADAGSDDGGDSGSSGGGGSGSGSSNFSSGSHGSESHLGTAGSTLKGYEKTSATTQSTPAELAMSYLYISLILALFNCSYLFFMRKT